jgi:hypothetical protein
MASDRPRGTLALQTTFSADFKAAPKFSECENVPLRAAVSFRVQVRLYEFRDFGSQGTPIKDHLLLSSNLRVSKPPFAFTLLLTR